MAGWLCYTFLISGRIEPFLPGAGGSVKFIAFLRGLFWGGVVGTIAGLLLAPESGDVLQARIRARYNEVLEEGRRAAAERRAELEAQFAEAKRAPH